MAGPVSQFKNFAQGLNIGMTTTNMVSRASVGFSAPVDMTNAAMHTSNPVIASVSKSVSAGSPIRHDLGLRLRADVGFASEMEADISSAPVASTAVAQIGNLLCRRLAVGSP